MSNNNLNGIDWKLLESTMSSATLAALKEHLNNKDEVPVVLDSNTTEQHSVDADLLKYKEQDYWDDRFESEDEYDWLASFQVIWPYLKNYLKNKDDRILIVGCGNSKFSEQLYDQGYENIYNIDFSANVISRMKSKHEKSRPKMQWIVMDMTNLIFSEDILPFDVVIDKASMDALMVDEGDVWNPKTEVIEIVDKMCLTTSNVLKKPDGLFIQISFAQPHFRTKYLSGMRMTNNLLISPLDVKQGYSNRYGWEIEKPVSIEKDIGSLNCYMYVMKLK